MTALERLQVMIGKLSPAELAELRAWLLEHGSTEDRKRHSE